MNEIMKKTYELIDVLENSDLIREFEVCKDRIKDNEEILELVQRGNIENDEYVLLDIKRKLYSNDDYKAYMNRYNELMYLVMDINARYGRLLGKGSCYK